MAQAPLGMAKEGKNEEEEEIPLASYGGQSIWMKPDVCFLSLFSNVKRVFPFKETHRT